MFESESNLFCVLFNNDRLQSKVSIKDYSANSKDVDYQMTPSLTRMNTVDDIDLHLDDVNRTLTKQQAHENHQISYM